LEELLEEISDVRRTVETRDSPNRPNNSLSHRS